MLKAVLDCDHCKERLSEVRAETYEELCYALQPLILAAHATDPHIKHRLSFKVVGQTELPSDLNPNELLVRCLHPNCRKAKTMMQTEAPLEMVGAMTIMFHTAHEGHPMEITYAGKTWRSPGPPEPPQKPNARPRKRP